MKQFIFIILCMILLISCDNGEEALNITTYDLSPVDYVIIRSDISSKEITSAAISLRKAVNETIGYDITLTTDWIKNTEDIPAAAKEIIIGETNRSESITIGTELKYDDYIIKYDTASERIIILGGSDFATETAVNFFINNFLNNKTNMFSIPEANLYTYKHEYKINSIALDGIDISKYIIIAEDTNTAEILRKYIINVTGINLEIDKKQKNEYEHMIIINSDDENCEIKKENGNIILTDNTYAVGFFMIDYLGYNTDITGDISVTLEDAKKYNREDFPVMEPINIYVSLTGDDNNDGTIENPFHTFNGAKEYVRNLKSTLLSPIIINFREGEYFIDEQISLTADDSGSQISPIIYQAYNNENVIFNGGFKIDSSYISSVTDNDILERIINKDAANNLMQLDYSNIDIEFPEIMAAGSSGTISEKTPEVYINGKALSQSRYPNDNIGGNAYLRTTEMESHGEDYKTAPFTFTYDDNENKALNWSQETLDNLYVYGFLAFDWTDGVYKVDNIDVNSKTITTTGGINFPPDKNTRFCFFNVLEEIDQPGESYIDRVNKKIYFYPTSDIETAEIYISMLNDYMISLQDVSHVTFKNIQFLYTRNRAIDAVRVDNFVIDGCTIAHTSYNAITITGTNCVIKNSHIYDTAKGGITISGGDRANLISANSIIENNRIHDNTRIFKTYQPAIGAYSVGLIIRHNELYNNPHEIIAIGSNDIIIEYNEIYNGVLESADMGAIYLGRDPSILGIEIRYNYFHDIGNTYGGIGQQSIFSDDGNTVPYIHSNIFYRGSTTTEMGGLTSNSYPIKAHGSQFGLIENNIIIDSPTAALFQPWTTDYKTMIQDTWFMWVYDVTDHGHAIWTKITRDVDMFGDLYKKTYGNTNAAPFWDSIDPELYDTVWELYKNNDTKALTQLAREHAPAYTNIFKNNVVIKIDYDKNGLSFIDNGTDINTYRADSDILESGKSMFVDYGTNFKLTDEGLAEIQKTIPDFKDIPFDKIGLQEK